ncbi:hypothetical protein AnigIFM59636_002870 [Aspergillus niger]|nr:hypothetical protein AnigIFM59636_002870 [Aspergillus niger]
MPFRPSEWTPREDPVVDLDMEGYINIPTVDIGGVQDTLLKYSIALYRLCDPTQSAIQKASNPSVGHLVTPTFLASAVA